MTFAVIKTASVCSLYFPYKAPLNDFNFKSNVHHFNIEAWGLTSTSKRKEKHSK
jgi:hypothetical protein